MQPTSGHQRYAAVVRVAGRTVVGLDFDGTLAPIVDDPARALIHPGAADALVELAGAVAAVAVITGRPAAQAVELGGLAEVGQRIEAVGSHLYLFGQYGAERWSSLEPHVVSPPPPPGYAAYLDELPAALVEAGVGDAFVEDKGLAVAVHTRRLPDPDEALDRLRPVLAALAARHELAVEPGHQVVEVRAGGTHKGMAVTELVEALDAAGFVFAGDDLGDVEAFEAVERLAAERGLAPLLVCSDPRPDGPLRARADLVVDGPDGVVDLLRRLRRDVAGGDDGDVQGADPVLAGWDATT